MRRNGLFAIGDPEHMTNFVISKDNKSVLNLLGSSKL